MNLKFCTARTYLIAFVMGLCCVYGSNALALSKTMPAIDINTCAGLQNMANNLQEAYQLTQDIDCTGIGFSPIGSADKPFLGSLNGNNHQIKNLTISKPQDSYVGLFGATEKAVIYDLTLTDVNVIGYSLTGSLIGQAKNTTLKNVKIQGVDITFLTDNPGDDAYVGGLIGKMDNSYVEDALVQKINTEVYIDMSILNQPAYTGGLIGFMSNSHVYHSDIDNGDSEFGVSGFTATGGLVGGMADSTVTASHAAVIVQGGPQTGGLVGKMTGQSSITDSSASGQEGMVHVAGIGDFNNDGGLGGLVGDVEGGTVSSSYSSLPVFGIKYYPDGYVKNTGGLIGISKGEIKDCYVNIKDGGMVLGDQNVGGLIGNLQGGTVTNTFASGKVQAMSSNGGGLIGAATGNGEVSDSYWDTQTTGQTKSAGGTGKTTAEMQHQATYVNWDFTNVWNIQEGTSYPWLRMNPSLK